MARLNHARHQHRGKRIEVQFGPGRNRFEPAEPANDGRVLSFEEKRRIAEQYGYKVA
jgi:hypothetical protein